MFRIGLLLVFQICACVVTGLSVVNMKDTEARPNWGIIMNRGPAVLNGVTKYRHTFKIDIPHFNFVAIGKMPCNTDDLKLLNCEPINELIDSVNNQTSVLAADSRRKVQLWLQSFPNIDDSRDASLQRRTRRRLLQEHTLGEDYCDQVEAGEVDLHENQNLLATLGTVWSDVSGTPTYDDIKIVDKHICELAGVSELIKDQIVKSEERLSSASKAFNNRIDAIQSGMANINTRVNEQNVQIQALAAQEYRDLNEVQTLYRKTLSGLNLVFRIERHLYEFLQAINNIEARVTEFGEGINVLMSGHLPPQFVSADDIQLVIDQIIADSYRGSLRLVENNPSFYYLTENIAFTKSDNERAIFVTLPFPPL